MKTKVIQEVRKVEGEILQGYTQMGSALYRLSSLARQLGMDLDSAQEGSKATFNKIHILLDEAGCPLDGNPDHYLGNDPFQLVDRIRSLTGRNQELEVENEELNKRLSNPFHGREPDCDTE